MNRPKRGTKLCHSNMSLCCCAHVYMSVDVIQEPRRKKVPHHALDSCSLLGERVCMHGVGTHSMLLLTTLGTVVEVEHQAGLQAW